MCVKQLKWARHVERMYETEYQNEIWKEVSEKEDLLRSRGIDRKTKCGRMASNCSKRKSGMQKQDIGMTGGRKEGRGTENYRKKNKKNLAKCYCVCTLRNLLFLSPHLGQKREALILLFNGYPVLTLTSYIHLIKLIPTR